MSPLYFLTTDNAAALVNHRAADPVAHVRDTFDELGLGCVVDNHNGRIVAQPLNNGPAGKPGLLLSVSTAAAAAGPPQRTGFYPGEQTWRHVRQFETRVQSPESRVDGRDDSRLSALVSGLFVGWRTDQPPTPEDLDNGNPHGVAGVAVTLSDGGTWVMPELREAARDGLPLPFDFHRAKLPTTIGHTLDGSLTRHVKRQFAELWADSGLWFDRWMTMLEEGQVSYDLDDSIDFVLRCLQLRYRLPAVLCDALELIDSNQLRELIEIAIGWPAIMEIVSRHSDDDDQKKTADTSPELNGDSGHAACAPGIGQREPNNGSPSTPAADLSGVS